MTTENDPAHERRKRYSEAIKSWELPERRLPVLLGGLIEKVMAVADAEQAELRAEVESMRRGDGAAARDLSNAFRRAAAAEAKVARVEALIAATFAAGPDGGANVPSLLHDLRAALAGSTEPEAPCSSCGGPMDSSGCCVTPDGGASHTIAGAYPVAAEQDA